MSQNSPQSPCSPQPCAHGWWTARLVPRSDGLDVLREFCASCGTTSTGSPLGHALPSVADRDVRVKSYKHASMTLGEIFARDPEYVRWVAVSSGASLRARKAAARLYCGLGYVPPEPGALYPASSRYDPGLGWDCIARLSTAPNPEA